MEAEKHKVVIIGAGVAGLIAAQELEKYDYRPLLLEAGESVGGRVKTDKYQGYLLDHGFQVLLTDYPEAKKYLDYDDLELRRFAPGAIVFDSGKSYRIGDPLRQPSLMAKMLFSPVGNFRDKIKIWRLTQVLKNKKIKDIFDEDSTTTRAYLEQKGFSEGIIENFFRPFFAGIFLESELRTSSRMFEFVFKMFSSGHAAIPANGMQEIPKQLLGSLHQSEIRYQSKVTHVEPQRITLEGGEVINADYIIIATDPHRIVPGLSGQSQSYRMVTNLYFSTSKRGFGQPLIGLQPDRNKMINNFHYVTDVSKDYAPKENNLLSVSIVGQADPMTKSIIHTVKEELSELLHAETTDFDFLQSYQIPYALPILEDLQYSVPPTSVKLLDGVYLAGDYMLYPSLNAAMTSGRIAAEAIAHQSTST